VPPADHPTAKSTCFEIHRHMSMNDHPLRTVRMLVVIALGMAWTHASALADGPPTDGDGELDRNGVLWAPFLEWSLPNPSWEGNPFDLEASATFTHQESGEWRTTPMFFDGGNAWKFRFTATRTGTWSVRTSSVDLDLDNRRGTITVQANKARRKNTPNSTWACSTRSSEPGAPLTGRIGPSRWGCFPAAQVLKTK
jgi:hypothetical protein